MSTATQPTAAELIDHSMATIMKEAHARVFLERIASRRPQYAPQNMAEAEQLVQNGFKIAQACAAAPADVVAQNKAANSRFAGAFGDLDRMLGSKQAGSADGHFQTALALAESPEIYNAALILKQAEALQLAEQAQAAG